MKTISEFQGEYRWLSNFWPCKGLEGPTVEHCYQAAKAIHQIDAHRILHMPTPGKAKYAAKFVEMYPDFENRKIKVMLFLLEEKFGSKNPDLRDKLLVTGKAILEEGNMWHDNFWGICHCGKCS